jgi:hypothetical protein
MRLANMRHTLTPAAFAVLLLSFGFLIAPVPAAAQNQDAAAAEVLFRNGRAAADAGDYAAACAMFHESERLDPALGTLLNIADCEERLGHLATAWTAYEEVAQRLPAEDPRHTIAATRRAALEPRLPRLRIHLRARAPAGTQVRRDGVALGTPSLDTFLPVDPGKHAVEITAPGRPPRTFDLSLHEGETKTLVVQPGDLPVVTEPPATSEQPRSGAKIAGYVVMGVGAAAAVAGVVTGILVLDRQGTVNDNCDADRHCNQTGLDAADSGKTLGVVTTVALATGAVGLGTGAVLVLSAGRDSRPNTGLRSGITLRGTF